MRFELLIGACHDDILDNIIDVFTSVVTRQSFTSDRKITEIEEIYKSMHAKDNENNFQEKIHLF